jgi:hypothetical protein
MTFPIVVLTFETTDRPTRMRSLFIATLLAAVAMLPASAADISGKWAFSVDIDGGGHGAPTFVLQQKAHKISGTYEGPLGTQKVTGTVTGTTAEFSFSADQGGQAAKATYKAKIESATTMSGTVSLEGGGGTGTGKWTAKKQ